MKKRSLVAALAMLVVSAIVLTSSTYAWFATSSAAAVDKFSATVTNNSGSLTVQAAGTNAANNTKKTTLTSSDFTGLATTLQPVSLYIDDANAVQINKVAYDAAKFDTFAAATQNLEYLHYEFNAEYINGGEAAASVKITPEFTTEAQFCYGLLAITFDNTTKYYYYDAAGGSYVPVKALSAGEVQDSNGNNIIDDADVGYSAADMAANVNTKATSTTSATALDLMSVDAGKTGTANIKVYVWAEGQDAQCSGIVSSAASSFNFSLAVV